MLIFDFDGVLMDSLPEVAVTVYNMLKGDIATRLDQLPQKALDLFLKNRFHVQPIGDAPVLMQWCLEAAGSTPHKLLSPREYDDLISRIEEPVSERTIRFFQTRRRFKEKDIEAWTALNRPVQPLWRLIIERKGSDLVLLTNKNYEATEYLCNYFGLQISRDNIYSGDNGTTKIENLTQIMRRFNKPIYTFIDDSVKNLRELDEHFNRGERTVSLIFAAWGYAGPDDANLARSLGYESLTKAQFMAQLDKHLA
jgi:phosphoglycolate phosphatase-like HAD superfamily hydrolase